MAAVVAVVRVVAAAVVVVAGNSASSTGSNEDPAVRKCRGVFFVRWKCPREGSGERLQVDFNQKF